MRHHPLSSPGSRKGNYAALVKKGKSADYVRERVWARQQRLEECPDGSLIFEITTTSEPELMSFVRSFGEEATLLSKADLPMEKPSEVL